MLCFEGKPIVKKPSLKGVVKGVLKNPKDLEQGNYTTNLKILTVGFPSGMFTKSSQNPQFIRNSMLASKIEQGFFRFAHEMFRYDTRST